MNDGFFGTSNGKVDTSQILIDCFTNLGSNTNIQETGVWSQMINVNNFRITFHNDDIKFSHKHAVMVSKIVGRMQLLLMVYNGIKQLQDVYSNHHMVNNYLTGIKPKYKSMGMTIDFGKESELQITMDNGVMNLVNQIPAELIAAKLVKAHSTNADDMKPPYEKLDDN